MSKPIKLVEVYSSDSAKGKIITRQATYPYGEYLCNIALAVLVVVKEDFHIKEFVTNNILNDTDSYQIRPKALYRSTRGIFYKEGSERRYLSKQNIIDLIIENGDLGKHLTK